MVSAGKNYTQQHNLFINSSKNVHFYIKYDQDKN